MDAQRFSLRRFRLLRKGGDGAGRSLSDYPIAIP
jgi:hypothetical protein